MSTTCECFSLLPVSAASEVNSLRSTIMSHEVWWSSCDRGRRDEAADAAWPMRYGLGCQ